MNKSVVTAIAIAACVSLVTSAEAKKQPEISGLALQQMQARDYETSKLITFPAVMTVLQDSGYRIASADKDTGLITGTASTKSKLSYNFFWGMGKSKKTPVVSAFIEERGSGSRVRLNFVMAKTKNHLYGISSSDEEPITDPVAYRVAFEKVEKEIFVRQALVNQPVRPVVNAAPIQPAVIPAQLEPKTN